MPTSRAATGTAGVTRSPTADDTAPSVIVEVLVFRLDGEAGLAYREVRARLRSPQEPDALALGIAGIAGAAPEWTVSHSTSWRCDPSGAVVLTYAVTPDPDPHHPAVALTTAGVLCSGDPLRPGPPALHVHHVAAHAVRHLSELATSDPTVREAAGHRPALWRVISQVGATMTAGSHAEIHAREHET